MLDFYIAKSKIPLDLPVDFGKRLWVAKLNHMGGLRLRIGLDNREEHGSDYPVSVFFDDVDGILVSAMLFCVEIYMGWICGKRTMNH